MHFRQTGGRVRTALDRLFLACGVLAALFLVVIGGLILTSIVTRWLGVFVPGLGDYAGYSMAAASFLALAYTFGHGGHIRVGLLVTRLHGPARRVVELWCHGVGAWLAGYLAWFSIKMVRVSFMLGDVSEGPDATPLWLPQLGMAIGATMLALALVTRFVDLALGAPPEDEGTDAARVE